MHMSKSNVSWSKASLADVNVLLTYIAQLRTHCISMLSSQERQSNVKYIEILLYYRPTLYELIIHKLLNRINIILNSTERMKR